MRIKEIYFIFFLSPMMVKQAEAQLDNRFFGDTTTYRQVDKHLYVAVDLLPFHKNNEYFNNIVVGRTYFGYQFLPRLIWYQSEKIAIELGGYFQKDFGNTSFRVIEPFMRFGYESNGFKLVFGNLEGGLTHRLIEPLFNFERTFAHRTEHGLQAKWQKKRWFLDTWVDWKRMIYEQSPFQEEIVGGFHAQAHLIQTPRFMLSPTCQLLAFHQGGQINAKSPADTTRPMLTNTFNTAFGMDAIFKRDTTQWLQAISLSAWQTYYSSVATPQGKGWYANALFTSRWGVWGASYWYGNLYNSAVGGQLFSSYTTVPDNIPYQETIREILICRYILPISLQDNNTNLQIRFEPYYDIRSSRIELSWGVYARFYTDFRLYQAK